MSSWPGNEQAVKCGRGSIVRRAHEDVADAAVATDRQGGHRG
jgi:hypothetical protein